MCILVSNVVKSLEERGTQSDLHICGFHILGFNQAQIENIGKEKF